MKIPREAVEAIIAGLIVAAVSAILLGATLKATRAGTIIPVPKIEDLEKER